MCETLWESEKLMTISLLALWIHYIMCLYPALQPIFPPTFHLPWTGHTESPTHLSTHICALPELPSPMFTCLSISHSSRSGSNPCYAGSIPDFCRNQHCLPWIPPVYLLSTHHFPFYDKDVKILPLPCQPANMNDKHCTCIISEITQESDLHKAETQKTVLIE